MDYYTISDDNTYPDRWYLGDIDVDEEWIFAMGQTVNENEYKNLTVEIDEEGIPLDFTETDGRMVPVVSESFAECLYEYMNEVQLLPVVVPKRTDNYYILVIRNAVDCVDESGSDFEKFEEGNDIRPDRVGDYEVINILKIDTSRVHNHIFRIAKYHVLAVVSGELKMKLEKAGLKGLKFELVS